MFRMNTEIKVVVGTTRIVFAIPCLGIAIKVAKIQPFRALSLCVWFAELQSWDKFLRLYLRGRTSLGLPYNIYAGIHANLVEAAAWKKYRHDKDCPFIRTYWSFLGLINVVPYRVSPQEDKDKIWPRLLDEIPIKTLWREHHTFSEERNYTFEGPRLKLIDYGSVHVVAAAHRHRKVFASITPLPA